MPITLQYGANPTVAMMAAYQGGKNAYRNKQEEEYRRLYMQQQQLQQQALLQREHMGYQFLATQGQMGFRADQQQKAIDARQGMAAGRLDADQNRLAVQRAQHADRRNMDRWKTEQNIGAKMWAENAKGGDEELGDPGVEGGPPEQFKMTPLPELVKPEIQQPRPPLAATGLGGYSPMEQRILSATKQRQQAQQRLYQRRIGYGQDLPNGATYDSSTGGYLARRPRTNEEGGW